MNNFCEQIVIKKSDSSDMWKKFVVIIGTILVSLITFFFGAPIIGLPFAFMLSFGVAFLGYFILSNMYYEFEYIVTNGELDVDKIIARKRRKRLVSVNAKNFTAFGQLTEDLNSEQIKTTLVAHDGVKNIFYAEFKDSTLGNTRLLFSPNEKVLSNLKPYIPRTIKQS